MHRFSRILLIFALGMLAACASAPQSAKVDPATAEKEVAQRVTVLLDRYVRNDQAGVVAMLDPERLVILGTSFEEKVKSPADLRALMDRDFSQWSTASYSDVRDVDARVDGALATVYFVMNWQAANGPNVPIRMTTTWRKVNGEWLLTQSSSALPPRF